MCFVFEGLSSILSHNQSGLLVLLTDVASTFIFSCVLQYDQYKTPMENIGLQDSLLSRFDLLFIMLDQMDPEQDREISDHVLRMHRYRAPGEQDGDGEATRRRETD